MTSTYVAHVAMVGRSAKPQECAGCREVKAVDTLRVTIIKSAGVHDIKYLFPVYRACNDDCARKAARTAFDSPNFR